VTDTNTPRRRPPRQPNRQEEPNGKPPFPWKRSSRTLIFWVALITLSALLVNYYSFSRDEGVEITYTEFIEQLEADNVSTVTIVDRTMKGEFKVEVLKTVGNKSRKVSDFQLLLPTKDPDAIIPRLEDHNVVIKAEEEMRSPGQPHGSVWGESSRLRPGAGRRLPRPDVVL